MSTGSTQKSRPSRSKNRSSNRRANAAPSQAVDTYQNDHMGMDRIISGYLRTHPQATLGTSSIFDLVNWSQTRFKATQNAAPIAGRTPARTQQTNNAPAATLDVAQPVNTDTRKTPARARAANAGQQG